ncbi:hypothetical protein GQ43DRAFT_190468 [Delitschia confertaspora ATCC 74209]|uniref:Uncharacterized protein n=1 Tax=Delitschia confertaspora ATCC 74209 TaxID=1513339 RepID=A0A9P4JE63_9PLEO|nr:hypothetical protein GQ43DRAFT_190468 [Delitschia confertaspora ATCC 74209]
MRSFFLFFDNLNYFIGFILFCNVMLCDNVLGIDRNCRVLLFLHVPRIVAAKTSELFAEEVITGVI